MDQTIFLWTILSTVLSGVQLFIQKVTAQEKRDSAFSGLMMYTVSGLLAFAVLLSLPEWPAEWFVVSLLGLAAGTIHGLGNFIRIEALKYIDSVLYFPINKVLGPLAVVVGGVWIFGEGLGVREYVGIALSVGVPLLLLSASEHHRQNDLRRGLVFVVASTLLTSISMLLTKQGLLLDPHVWLILCMSQLTGAVSSAAIYLRRNGSSLAHAPIDRRDVYLGLILGILGFISYVTLLLAVQRGFISIVYAIHAHYILIPIVLSVWWYGEHINIRKTAAIILSLLAIGILYDL